MSRIRKFGKITKEIFDGICSVLQSNEVNGNRMTRAEVGKIFGVSDCTVTRVAKTMTWEKYQELLAWENAKRADRVGSDQNPDQIQIDPAKEDDEIDLDKVIFDAIDSIIDGFENLRGALLSK